MLKHEKSKYLNSISHLNYTKYEKNVVIQNCLLQKKSKNLNCHVFLHDVQFFFLLKKYY